MRWLGGRESGNVEDRRGGGRGLAIGGLSGTGLIIVLLASWLFGINPLRLLSSVQSGPESTTYQQQPRDAAGAPVQDEGKRFVAVVLAQTEDTWGEIFSRAGASYRPPRLVLFTDAVDSACGTADSAVGPFYCPGDAKVYLDLSFFRQLARLGGPGDFAQGYVIAHEVGHHVQNLLGTSAKARDGQEHGGRMVNEVSVRLELQADCYAGIWAHHLQRAGGVIEAGDIDEALTAAAAIGDDTLQRRAQGRVVPDSFTHGTSADRVSWFRRGYESGAVDSCDTFGR